MYGYGYSLYNQVPFGRGGIDPSASAFFTATGITGATQQAAINALVTGLKTDGLWSKMKAVYPFVTDNRNLLSYTNTLTQTSYWNQVSVTLTSGQTDPTGGTNATRIVGTGAASLYGLISLTAGATYTLSCYVKSTSGSNQTFRIYANGGSPFSPNLTATSTWQQVTLTFTAIAGTNSFGITRDSSTNNFDILSYGIQMELGSTATTYQPISTTQQAYIASQFKYNLKDPRDLDAAFRLVFNGGWTHSSNGATPNGTNGYADTFLNPNGTLSVDSIALSYYSRTQSTSISGGAMGSGVSAIGNVNYLAPYYSAVSSKFFASGLYPANIASSANTTTTGLVIGSKTAINSRKLYLNSTLLNTNSTSYSFAYANNSFYLGALNYGSPQFYSAFQCAFSTIGDGLTDTDAANLYTRVQAFQTALSRQV